MRRSESMVDTDGLQADVMRFMAIIAFCMIAIMTLVQQMGDPALELSGEPESASLSVRAPLPDVRETRETGPRSSLPLNSGVVTPANEIPVPKPARVPLPVKGETVVVPGTMKSSQSDLHVQASGVATPEAPVMPQLTLRFASDRVFLGQIAAGNIKVFARNGANYLELSLDFRARPGRPTGQLYELVAASVPARVKNVLGQAETYLVSLPPGTQRAVSDRVSDPEIVAHGGALIIQGNGEVKHEI